MTRNHRAAWESEHFQREVFWWRAAAWWRARRINREKRLKYGAHPWARARMCRWGDTERSGETGPRHWHVDG